MLSIFPAELEQRPEFQEFQNAKYAEMVRAVEKDPVTIMKTPRLQRNAKDLKKMREFFSQFEFLKYQ